MMNKKTWIQLIRSSIEHFLSTDPEKSIGSNQTLPSFDDVLRLSFWEEIMCQLFDDCDLDSLLEDEYEILNLSDELFQSIFHFREVLNRYDKKYEISRETGLDLTSDWQLTCNAAKQVAEEIDKEINNLEGS